MLEITSKEIKVTPAVKEKIEACLAKLDRYNKPITNAHVTLIKNGDGINRVEAAIHIRHNDIQAIAENENLFAAINGAVSKLTRQMNKVAHKPHH